MRSRHRVATGAGRPRRHAITPAAQPISEQRATDPAWLRSQIRALVQDCDENIAEDQGLADLARDEKRDMYLSRVEGHRHWKRQLERILRGETAEDALADDLTRWGIVP